MSFINEPEEERTPLVDDPKWSPERKVVGSAVAVVVLWLLQLFIADLSVPAGLEGAIAVIVAYFMPNER